MIQHQRPREKPLGAAACVSTGGGGVGGTGIPNASQPVPSQQPPTQPPPCVKPLPQKCNARPSSGGLPRSRPSGGLALDLFGSVLCRGRLSLNAKGIPHLVGSWVLGPHTLLWFRPLKRWHGRSHRKETNQSRAWRTKQTSQKIKRHRREGTASVGGMQRTGQALSATTTELRLPTEDGRGQTTAAAGGVPLVRGRDYTFPNADWGSKWGEGRSEGPWMVGG